VDVWSKRRDLRNYGNRGLRPQRQSTTDTLLETARVRLPSTTRMGSGELIDVSLAATRPRDHPEINSNEVH
jgi:hypothetical protein